MPPNERKRRKRRRSKLTPQGHLPNLRQQDDEDEGDNDDDPVIFSPRSKRRCRRVSKTRRHSSGGIGRGGEIYMSPWMQQGHQYPYPPGALPPFPMYSSPSNHVVLLQVPWMTQNEDTLLLFRKSVAPHETVETFLQRFLYEQMPHKCWASLWQQQQQSQQPDEDALQRREMHVRVRTGPNHSFLLHLIHETTDKKEEDQKMPGISTEWHICLGLASMPDVIWTPTDVMIALLGADSYQEPLTMFVHKDAIYGSENSEENELDPLVVFLNNETTNLDLARKETTTTTKRVKKKRLSFAVAVSTPQQLQPLIDEPEQVQDQAMEEDSESKGRNEVLDDEASESILMEENSSVLQLEIDDIMEVEMFEGKLEPSEDETGESAAVINKKDVQNKGGNDDGNVEKELEGESIIIEEQQQEEKLPEANQREQTQATNGKSVQVGALFLKRFPKHGLFQGEVTSLPTEKNPFYNVLYEDGDVEDLSEKQMMRLFNSAASKKLRKKKAEEKAETGEADQGEKEPQTQEKQVDGSLEDAKDKNNDNGSMRIKKSTEAQNSKITAHVNNAGAKENGGSETDAADTEGKSGKVDGKEEEAVKTSPTLLPKLKQSPMNSLIGSLVKRARDRSRTSSSVSDLPQTAEVGVDEDKKTKRKFNGKDGGRMDDEDETNLLQEDDATIGQSSSSYDSLNAQKKQNASTNESKVTLVDESSYNWEENAKKQEDLVEKAAQVYLQKNSGSGDANTPPVQEVQVPDDTQNTARLSHLDNESSKKDEVSVEPARGLEKGAERSDNGAAARTNRNTKADNDEDASVSSTSSSSSSSSSNSSSSDSSSSSSSDSSVSNESTKAKAQRRAETAAEEKPSQGESKVDIAVEKEAAAPKSQPNSKANETVPKMTQLPLASKKMDKSGKKKAEGKQPAKCILADGNADAKKQSIPEIDTLRKKSRQDSQEKSVPTLASHDSNGNKKENDDADADDDGSVKSSSSSTSSSSSSSDSSDSSSDSSSSSGSSDSSSSSSSDDSSTKATPDQKKKDAKSNPRAAATAAAAAGGGGSKAAESSNVRKRRPLLAPNKKIVISPYSTQASS